MEKPQWNILVTNILLGNNYELQAVLFIWVWLVEVVKCKKSFFWKE